MKLYQRTPNFAIFPENTYEKLFPEMYLERLFNGYLTAEKPSNILAKKLHRCLGTKYISFNRPILVASPFTN